MEEGCGGLSKTVKEPAVAVEAVQVETVQVAAVVVKAGEEAAVGVEADSSSESCPVLWSMVWSVVWLDIIRVEVGIMRQCLL